ncbi:hypothetical protein GPUN_2866 [Glaciecola punicea ACAM 611]|jgi:predicted dehydrogenase|uniref:Uncharacterized protein n=1 Tax=Glaciecola punicea ACAM 611 TaxID=1121923 RepID=H5TF53_9ALTE|nr:Gfo/Idh/MocA family oxidoreductase [Glaciecola punicea]GAB56980.1 hypothetical protein GPUN_2866 [Glaciecola punicea ACAM 611]
MIAIIGYGNHVKNTIVPALVRANINIRYILVRDMNLSSKLGTINFTNSIDHILNDTEVTHVYIATPLSTHYHFCKLALLAKKNVLCEKPIAALLHQTEELFAIAQASNVLLDEMLMFSFHKQFKTLQKVMTRSKLGKLLRLTTCFQVPHLQRENIRYDKNKGGGALFDIGFYPIAASLLLLKNCKFSSGKVFSQKSYDVDLTGAALFYSNEGACGIASWGLGAIYKNYIKLEYSDAEIIVNRAFSKPFNLETEIEINHLDGSAERILIKPNDHFAQQFSFFLSKSEYSSERQTTVINRISVMAQLITTLNCVELE